MPAKAGGRFQIQSRVIEARMSPQAGCLKMTQIARISRGKSYLDGDRTSLATSARTAVLVNAPGKRAIMIF